jgi:hypothetical protein
VSSFDLNPIPLYIEEETGAAAGPLSDAEVSRLRSDRPPILPNKVKGGVLATDSTVDDPSELSETGWGVLYASDLADGVREQLKPLLDKRKQDVGKASDLLFKEFTVEAGTTARDWCKPLKVDLSVAVRPRMGVPYYLLIVGSPESISFEFQALLKMQFAVGRLYFDDLEDYGRYAASVVAYETTQPEQAKNAAVWITGIPGDPATQMLSTALKTDFTDPDNPLGAPKFNLEAFIGVDEATRPQLIEILRGNLEYGRPAVIFVGTHGLKCKVDATNPARQLARQGALITQEYNPAQPAPDTEWLLTGGDVPDDARLDGTMVVLFACFSGGCPRNNSYKTNPDGSPIPVALNDMICRLPQVLLSRGALAVLGHVDAAFPYSFQGADGAPTPQVLRDPLQRLMQGRPAGWATASLSLQWTMLSVQLDSPEYAALETSDPGLFGHVVTAKTNAKNYILLGDPAVKLRVKELRDPGMA